MFAIADEREDGRSYWWCGGLIWLANVDEAAKFEPTNMRGIQSS
jgi:hypothetical protein